LKDGRLTEKQRRFIDYYIMTGGRKLRAARLAGYTESSVTTIAQDNLAHPAIRAAILERQRALARDGIAGLGEIEEYWTSVMRGQEVETCFNRSGRAYHRQVRANLRVEAAGALAKAQGAFPGDKAADADEDRAGGCE